MKKVCFIQNAQKGKFMKVNLNKNISDKNFFIVDYDKLMIAGKTLKHGTLLVWMYLIGNSTKKSWNVRIKHIEKTLGITERTFYRALTEMCEKGYAVKQSDGEYLVYDKQNVSGV